MALPAAVEARKLEELPDFHFHTIAFQKSLQWWRAALHQLRPTVRSAIASWLGASAVALLTIYFEVSDAKGFWSAVTSKDSLAGYIAGLAFLFVVLFLRAIWAVATARKRVQELGEWHENRFVFRSPILLKTILARTEDNHRKILVTAPAAPKISVIHCTLENPHNSKLFQATAQSAYCFFNNWENIFGNRPWPSFASGPLNVAVRINRKHEFYLEWVLPSNALPQELRIKMTSFEIQDPNEKDGFRFFHWHVSQPSNGYDIYARGNPRELAA